VQKGVRCNAIAPGTVDTPSLADRINAFADPVEARKMFIARQPMGRLAKAEEIAPIVVFLASDESAFATGQIFSVDGGMTI
jgi:2-keto-3-deoxy-L-fuconate dehydrogenase